MRIWLALASFLLALAAPAHAQAPSLADALREYQLQESARPARELLPDWTAPRNLVVVTEDDARTAWLQQAMPEGVRVLGVRSEAEAAPWLAEADALVLSGCRAATIDRAPRLRWVQAGGAGSDQCLTVPRIAGGQILLTDSRKVKNTILAEMAMGYVFTLARSIDVGIDNQRRGDLNARGGRPGIQLHGATMLIVGLGGSGTEIARIAHSVGMRVIATRNSGREGPDFVERVGLADELPAMIGEADVVVICAPLTPATRGLFNAAMLARMKRGAMLINWTRAEITVPEDLAAALASGQLGSAALNWATSLPLPPEHPLWRAPNLILAPWTGTGGGPQANRANESPAETEMRWLVVRENMRRFAAGERMFSVFDLQRGY